ncbi:transmembrane protein [Cystoisospora suis]|uniref:Transmembrane protein n=1 Tax=Cystoisospora suis TaxID=483139 RepID=A0A2C6L8W3_9APIC|nr:transmembrane protein [Cystoisospora suis]
MYNWCPEQDRLTIPNSKTPLFLSCRVVVEFFDYDGQRSSQQYMFNSALYERTAFTFTDPETYPEMKALGFWVHGPDEGENSNKIVIAFWSALCRRQSDVRICSAAKGCPISLTRPDSNAPSCLMLLYGAEVVMASEGDRVCSGETAWPHGEGACYHYEVPNPSIGDIDGWQTGDSKAHGYRPGSPAGVRYHGGRYGAVFVVRFRPEGTVEWATRVADDAFVDYEGGLANGLSGEKGDNTDGSGSQARYSVTYYTHSWQVVDGKPVLRPLCLTQLVKDDGQLGGSGGAVLNKKCTRCSSRPTSRVHPRSHEWASICTNSQGDNPGIFINDNLVVDSKLALKAEGIDVEPTGLYPIEQHAQIVPWDTQDWLVFWRTATHKGTTVRPWGNIQTGKLMIAKWNPTSRVLGPANAIAGGLSVLEYTEPRVSRLSQQTLLVAYSSSLRHSTTFTEVLVNEADFEASPAVSLQKILGNALTNPAFSTEWVSPVDGLVLWLTRASPGRASDNYVWLRPTAAYPGLTLQLLRAEKAVDRLASWQAETRCGSTCNAVQTTETTKTAHHTCLSPAPSVPARDRGDGDCQPLELASVLEGTFGAEPTDSDKANALSVSDGDIETAVEFAQIPSSFTANLKEPSDIWEIGIVFVVRPENWSSAPSVSCGVFDRQENLLGTRSGLLGRVPPPNTIQPANRTVSYWKWDNMRLFGVQAIQCSVSDTSSTTLVVAELEIMGKTAGACPSEGFFGISGCPSEEARPVFDVSVLDCQGVWSAWSACDTNCVSTRVFTKKREAQWGGRPCEMVQKRPCTDGPWCEAALEAGKNSALIDRRQACASSAGPWSSCLHCRRLRYNHITAEAAGPGVEACPDAVEMQFCNDTCRLQYDFEFTATSTFAPVITAAAVLVTFQRLSTTLVPLSWRRWFTMDHLATAAWVSALVAVLLFLILCIFCSFRPPPTRPPPKECLPEEAEPLPSTVRSMSRRATARVQSVVSKIAVLASSSPEATDGHAGRPSRVSATAEMSRRPPSCDGTASPVSIITSPAVAAL